LCAITDNFTLGSKINLQRDLFELSLDLDAFVSRSKSLNDAMEGLREQCESIVRSRLHAYDCPTPEELLDAPVDAWESLSRSAMGVPRTIGIVLQQAWNRANMQRGTKRIRKSDISYGVAYASQAYQRQVLGAARDGVALPQYVEALWSALLDRARTERSKVRDVDASHFMIHHRYEHLLRHLTTFFLIHLLDKGRTTKKESLSRNLYCFDFGVCEENNLGFAVSKNVLRQQRFVYDDVVSRFEAESGVRRFKCPKCGRVYRAQDLVIAGGQRISFCIDDKTDLVEEASDLGQAYTEEEAKIVGAIRSSRREDQTIARQIADDVGCYVQKVSKFGEKLEREGIISRAKEGPDGRYVYYSMVGTRQTG